MREAMGSVLWIRKSGLRLNKHRKHEDGSKTPFLITEKVPFLT